MFVSLGRLRGFAPILGAGILGTALSSATSPAEETKPAEDPPAAPQAAVDRPAQQAMRKLAAEVKFTLLAGESTEARPLKLRPQPLVSYGDETRFIKDSTLWVWLDGARPALFQKLEVNDWVNGSPLWTWCFASAAPGLVEGAWPGITNRIQTKTELTWNTVPEESVPENATGWPLAARALNRRFVVEDDTAVVLRPVARPILEFKAPDQNVPYGAVFSHARGTNPDFLLILQVETTPAGERRWSYAPVHMTSAGVTLKLNDQKVWADPPQKPHEVTNWGYFFTPRDPAIK